MKNAKTVLLLLMLLAAYSCHSGGDQNHSLEEHHHFENGVLKLNDGKKWQADQPTRENVAHLQSLAVSYESEPPSSVSGLQTFGSEVNEGINQMIRECTMTGEADEALHHWFFPIMNKSLTFGKC